MADVELNASAIFVFGQPPGRIFVGQGVAPNVTFAIVAQSVEMGAAVAHRPEAWVTAAERIGNYRKVFAPAAASLTAEPSKRHRNACSSRAEN
jgi:hypothetical protein